MATNFKSPGAEASRALRDHLVRVEAQRRAAADAAAAEDRQRRIATEDRDYVNTQERQRVEDSRYETEQRQKALDRADAAGNRYLDVERGYYDAEKQRQFDAAEAV